jgi:hypothetical protein
MTRTLLLDSPLFCTGPRAGERSPLATATEYRPRLTTAGIKRLRRIYQDDKPWPEASFTDWLASDTLDTLYDCSPDDAAFLDAVREAHPDERRLRDGH